MLRLHFYFDQNEHTIQRSLLTNIKSGYQTSFFVALGPMLDFYGSYRSEGLNCLGYSHMLQHESNHIFIVTVSED
jgi:hypothetical protein